MDRKLRILLFIIVALGIAARGNTAVADSAVHPISMALDQLMESGNFKEAKRAIEGYTVEVLAALPDSILFDYYYLKGVIKANEGNEKGKRLYLSEAKKLCEKSLGIHTPVYLEICLAIGNSYEEDGDIVSAFEIYQAALIQSIGLYSLKNEDVKWQYEKIEDKVKKWYKNDSIRSAMVARRIYLSPRDAATDAMQNDMDFYARLYNDIPLREKVQQADRLMASGSNADAAKIYLEVASVIKDNPVARATLQELAAKNFIDIEDFLPAEELLVENIRLLDNHKSAKTYRRSLSLLSTVYSSLHNYKKAKEFAEKAKFSYEEELDFSRAYILCLHRCATLERGSENFFLALLLEDVAIQELYRNQALGIISGKSDAREALLCNLLSSAALHYNQFGFRKEATDNMEHAIALAEKSGMDASPYYNNLSTIYLADKEFEKAVGAARKAYGLADMESRKIEIGTTLGLCQFLARQPISSDIISESSQYLDNLVSKTFSFTSTEERREFWTYFQYYYPLLNFFAYESGDKNLTGRIYDNILAEKGLLLRTSNQIRDEILRGGDHEDITLYDSMLQLRKLLPSLSGKDAESAKSEIERIDKLLTRKYSAYADFTTSNGTSWQTIQANLKDDDIAIEFYNIPEVKWHEDGSDADGAPRYCAITLKKGYDHPHIIPLFREETLTGIQPEKLYRKEDLYKLIWSPLKKELKGVKNIYFAADRELHKIGIEYAQLPDETVMGDHYNLYRLSTTRALAENKQTAKPESAVLYGGLIYDMKAEDLISESRNGEFHSGSGSRAFLGDNMRSGFQYLPGTLEEVEKISRNFTDDGVKKITGKPGTEESFKALAGTQADIIHLATHGFFWTDEDARENKGVSFLKLKTDQTSSEDWALLRSGLIFSGANIGLRGEELPADVEDGILTALELSNMNLGHVDLVVMSACESGLGETSGEGVFGLQRGFKLAGANSLLMSLWKVDDDATQLLMTSFYHNLMSGQSKQQALHNAQKTLRDNPRYYDPKYWAAFILLDALN